MSTSTITPIAAKLELLRRSLPKSDPARAHIGGDTEAPIAKGTPAFAAGGAELLAIAGPVKAQAKTQAKAQAQAPVRSAADKRATAKRKQAWEFRIAEHKAGRKVSYADACKKFGVKPAKAV